MTRGRPFKATGISPIDWANCGTEANYRRHYRLGEKPCAKCLRAYNEIHKERRRKNAKK